MKRLSADELREAYLRFFEEKGHKRLPSASLVPHGDPTMLLTSAGMVPFKPYFLGTERPENPRITTCQRCLRTPDIDHVGYTDRHGTFFEMLGNFSFGDYFKQDAIAWAWEFVTERLELPKDDLWVTIYLDDDEAFSIWNEKIGIPAERIVRLGREDNFWEIGVGPCGPCSEIFVDRGDGCGHADCRPGCERCERFFEIWNLVFIQYDQDADGNLHPLKSKGIDTGMGLERTAAFLQGVSSIFEIDTIRPILDFVADKAQTTYGVDEKKDVSLRVITDHMRGVCLLVMDGVLPSNEGRGYVLRRLLRRAARHARLLGIEEAFLTAVADVVRQQLGYVYPELNSEFGRIVRVIEREEQRFHETLDQGIELLSNLIDSLKAQGLQEIPGKEAFRLHDTYGFPLELTEEIAADRGFTVDRAEFDQEMARQRETARAARANIGYLGTDRGASLSDLNVASSEFCGYERTTAEAQVVALIQNGEVVSQAKASDEPIEMLLNVTPFYPEGGGQVSDTGTITSPHGQLVVDEVVRTDAYIIHRGQLVSGVMNTGDTVLATVDERLRRDTERHHTGTHLLHKALRTVLGDHASQAGSLVAPDRLRFDFTHFEPLTSEELTEIESIVNQRILDRLPVLATVTNREEALRQGAMALFGEKYGDEVRMVSIGEFSLELCGGTHVSHTSDLGLFKIVSESSVASGVRRIEALAGRHALDYVNQEGKALATVASRLQVAPLEVPEQLDRLTAQMKDLERELSRLKDKLSAGAGVELASRATELNGIKVLAARVDASDMQSLRRIGDTLRDQLKQTAFLLGSATEDKVFLVAMATPDAVEQGLRANDLVRKIAPIVGGGGGGSPTMAQAGGKAPDQLDQAIEEANKMLQSALKA